LTCEFGFILLFSDKKPAYFQDHSFAFVSYSTIIIVLYTQLLYFFRLSHF